MASKNILKNTRNRSAVEVYGTGNATINIYELAYSDQTVDAPNVVLTISDVIFSLGSAGNVVRNGNLIFALTNTSPAEFNFTNGMGVSLRREPNANVLVNLGSSEGSVILQFVKEAGYVETDQQTLQPKDR